MSGDRKHTYFCFWPYLPWKNRGVHFVSDLINHENKQFYSFEQIQEKLETNNFLKFYRLIARIPKAFKDYLKENFLDIHFDTHDTTDTFQVGVM
jgi:hypothetical protein